jgi:hypothetical protein
MDASIPIAAAMIAGPLFMFVGYLLGRIPRRQREPGPADLDAFDDSMRQARERILTPDKFTRLDARKTETIEDRARKQQ